MKKKTVEIQLFGKFEIRVDGEPVLLQLKNSAKTLNLVQYLLLKRGPATHAELIEALWPESESTNPSSALRTMLHRFRTMLDENGVAELKNCIITGRGACEWNREINCTVDINEMERLVQAAHAEGATERQRIAAYLGVVELYTGPLLPDAADELWVMPRNVYYHDVYIDCVLELIGIYKAQQDYHSVLSVCRRAMDVEPYDERLHVELMLSLVKTGKNSEALAQYYCVSDMHNKQLDVRPSKEVRELYRLIVQADQQMESDIDDIQHAIENDDKNDAGAFVCEYEIFKDIYRLERRMLERYSTTMFIGLFTIRTPYDQDMDPLVLDSIMRSFLDIAQAKLRRGDTISRYSVTQYVVMLPSVTHESGNMIMDRIKRGFYDAYVKPSVMVTYKLRPLNIKK